MSETWGEQQLKGVVGVVATPAGLRSLRALLAAVPSGLGLAFVVCGVPDVGDLPAHPVVGVTVLRPGEVYLTVSGRVRVSGATLSAPAPAAPPDPLQADRLLVDLAEAWEHRLLAVILAGPGAAGAVGLRAVHARGGVVLAETPTEGPAGDAARHALRTGFVDRAAPIDELPALIERGIDAAAPSSLLADGDVPRLAQVIRQLERVTGHDLTCYDPGLVVRRVSRRMRLAGASDPEAYAAALEGDPGEAEQLFRQVHAVELRLFDGLDPLVPDLRRLLAGGAPDPLRAWCVGVGTGEEPYALAAVLLEQLGPSAAPGALEVVATDLHEPSLRQAHAGRFPRGIALDVTASRLGRFFERDGEEWVAGEALRRAVRFVRHDLLQDPPLTGQHVVCCRDQLGRLAPEHRRAATERLRSALVPDGVLLIDRSFSVQGPSRRAAWRARRRCRRTAAPAPCSASASRACCRPPPPAPCRPATPRASCRPSSPRR
ncbi:MAG: CheR family methyltransferase [Myxococcota bacterium]